MSLNGQTVQTNITGHTSHVVGLEHPKMGSKITEETLLNGSQLLLSFTVIPIGDDIDDIDGKYHVQLLFLHGRLNWYFRV